MEIALTRILMLTKRYTNWAISDNRKEMKMLQSEGMDLSRRLPTLTTFVWFSKA